MEVFVNRNTAMGESGRIGGKESRKQERSSQSDRTDADRTNAVERLKGRKIVGDTPRTAFQRQMGKAWATNTRNHTS